MFNMFGGKKREEAKTEKKSDFEIEEDNDTEQGGTPIEYKMDKFFLSNFYILLQIAHSCAAYK